MSKNYTSALSMLVSVFFFWGFVAAGNDILIPVFKKSLNLEQWQAQMISFCFYVAYTIGSIIYYGISHYLKKDLLNIIGYKNGLIYGLLLSAFGAFLFQPAAMYESFGLMLTGLFIVGLGFSLQQTAANPLAINLGDPETGSQRLSMAGGINNIGTTIAPVLISMAIFGVAKVDSSQVVNLESVKLPYLLLCAAFVLVAIAIKFSKIPDQLEVIVKDAAVGLQNFKLKNHPNLYLGMIGIFVYVGVEVSTAANLAEYLKTEFKMTEDMFAPYVSLFWGSLMVGRWAASVDIFKVNSTTKHLLRVLVPGLAFGLFLLMIYVVYGEVAHFFPYIIPIIILLVATHLSAGRPERQLLLFSMLGILALIIGIFTSGSLSIFALISVGLFCSTLWPCIFDLAIKDLGRFTNQGSGLLIMMIMGGGFISVSQGILADESLLGIRQSYWVGVLCFTFLAYYAYYMWFRYASRKPAV